MPAFARRASTAIRRRRDLTAAWKRASARDRTELARFAVLIPLMTVAVRTIGFNRTRDLLAASSRSATGPRDAAEISTRALIRARRYAPYRGNCLPQSLALWWRLRRQGVDAEFCLGAALTGGGDLAAHAWVEAEGRPLNDNATVRARFAPFTGVAVSRLLR
jgi:hypothetical protein